MDAVRRQVASIGGAVSITSSAGKGVCVTMSIPVDDMPELGADV
jgi:chemotaxis protein histidine kinase CheA